MRSISDSSPSRLSCSHARGCARCTWLRTWKASMFCEYTITRQSARSRASRASTSPLLASWSGALPRSQSMMARTGRLDARLFSISVSVRDALRDASG